METKQSNFTVPTVLDDLAECSDTARPGKKRHGIQVFIPGSFDPREVAEVILKEFSSRIVITVCDTIMDAKNVSAVWSESGAIENYIARLVIWYSEVDNGKDNCLRAHARLKRVLKDYYVKADEIPSFLRDIEACASGSKFALKYKSMAEVWDAMLDKEKWDYLDYVAKRLCETDLNKFSLKVDADKVSVLVKSMSLYKDGDRQASSIFTKGHLRKLNPFN